MFRFHFLFLLAVVWSTLGVDRVAKAAEPSSKLVAALIQVESGGDDNAVGDKYLPKKDWAYGPLQIRQCYVDDVNARFQTKYRAVDCRGNRALSVKIFERYMAIYATKKRLGREPAREDIARIHNGGPSGYKRTSTKKYWEKVKKELAKQGK